MFQELRKRAQKAGQPPGTLVYTGEKKVTVPRITVISYTKEDFKQTTGHKLEECLPAKKPPGITWLHVEGLHVTALIEEIAKFYNLHPLTVEDILNVQQRPKIEEFSDYYFITLKMLRLSSKKSKIRNFTVEQLSIVVGEDFVLSFQEGKSDIFNLIRQRLTSGPDQRLRQHGSDYLMYRLIDTVVDYYFVVLEAISDRIEKVEEIIIVAPTPQNSRTLYRLKRQLLTLRKAIWPLREVMSRLLLEEKLISSFTRLYLRDVYDHTVQAIDTLETFRDLLSGMLDVYLSSLTNRLNEIMKILTIITTIFIPITFIASVYGMNFKHMPELLWRWSYPLILTIMIVIAVFMLAYFRRRKWI